MRIEIFDVEHGQCAMVHCPDGKKLMVDTGHNSSRPWRPSEYFRAQVIDCLIHTNCDRDHTSDLVGVKQNCTINTILHNPSIGSRELAAMKAQGGMDASVESIYQWLQQRESTPGGGAVQDINLGGVLFYPYWINYNPLEREFAEPNNLSVVTFVSHAGFTILFPGDLEIAGWQRLLQLPDFQSRLRQVNVLVASHHGRDNGCCAEVFNYCAPDVVVISDGGVEFSTQETQGWYARRVLQGITWPGDAVRKVLTTRHDGHIVIDVDSSGNALYYTERQLQTGSAA